MFDPLARVLKFSNIYVEKLALEFFNFNIIHQISANENLFAPNACRSKMLHTLLHNLLACGNYQNILEKHI